MTRGRCLLKGLLICALAVPMPGAAHARNFRVLHVFKDTPDGATPWSELLFNGGKFYGTTLEGGTANDGTVYKMDAKGRVTLLYSFQGGNDGRRPLANVIADGAGNLYGVTDSGGSYDQGTAYRLAPDGTETVIHTFTGGSDGGNSDAGLVLDNSGNLFGTTPVGGPYQAGVAFEISANGTFSVLHSFADGSDGGFPEDSLMLDNRGNLYGTAVTGGAYGFGAVYRISADGKFKVVYSFAGGTDGTYPQARVIQDKAGNLYGTTDFGGGVGCSDSGGCGTIFKLAPDGTETVLHAFTGGSDGAAAYNGVVPDKEGNLYAATKAGGNANGYGALDKLAADGTFSVLHVFRELSDGEYPDRGVIDPRTGNFYGAAYTGGGDGWGTVFEFRNAVPEPP
ncbi:MAG TPA: choice-of-anchor tandem repeat GloVer-containing protein [Rhizomicrobium sp.]|nr:choice-of-anchor tandem repeat GloVer-containing protein [Rhizomicrobium sp.]